MFRKQTIKWVLPAALFLATFLAGCGVSEEDYEQAVQERANLRNDLLETREEIQTLLTEIDKLREDKEELSRKISEMEKNKIVIEQRVKRLRALVQEKLPSENIDSIVGEAGTETSQTMVYTVEDGDSLWSIARKFSTSVDTVKTLNDMGNNMIRPGQQILVPQSQ